MVLDVVEEGEAHLDDRGAVHVVDHAHHAAIAQHADEDDDDEHEGDDD